MPSVIDVAEWVYDALTGRRQPRLARVVVGCLSTWAQPAPVLDLGSGNGRIAVEVERARGVRVTACDIDLDAVLRADARPSGGAIVADGCALPFAPDSFAAVSLVYVLHHVHDQRKLLAEVRHVLSDHGQVILVELDSASALVRAFRILARLTGRRCHFHTLESLIELVRASGFDAVPQVIDRATFVVIGERRDNGRDASRDGKRALTKVEILTHAREGVPR